MRTWIGVRYVLLRFGIAIKERRKYPLVWTQEDLDQLKIDAEEVRKVIGLPSTELSIFDAVKLVASSKEDLSWLT